MNGCNGHGDCVAGQCKCNPGYGGEFCNQSKFLKYLFIVFLLFLAVHFCRYPHQVFLSVSPFTVPHFLTVAKVVFLFCVLMTEKAMYLSYFERQSLRRYRYALFVNRDPGYHNAFFTVTCILKTKIFAKILAKYFAKI